MSRTDKDRPWWVKRNDPTLLHYTEHNHLILGRIFYKEVYVRDTNGNYVTEEVINTRKVFRKGAAEKAGFSNEYNFSFVSGSSLEYEKRYAYLWREEEYVTVEYVTKRIPSLIYSDHCTEGERLKDSKDHLPCEAELTIEDFKKSSTCKADRQMFHGDERARKRDILNRYAKEANTYGWEELQDDDTPDYLERSALWW